MANNDNDIVDLVSSEEEEEAVTITTLTDYRGNHIQQTRGRPRTNPIRFSAVTTDPFDYDGRQLFFVIRGKPVTKKRPGYGYQQGQRYNSTAGLEHEFRDVVYKLFQHKGIEPSFGRGLMRIRVTSCFPPNNLARIIQAGDTNNLVNFVQDSLQRHLYRDDGQFIDCRGVKKVGAEFGTNGYTKVYLTTSTITV